MTDAGLGCVVGLSGMEWLVGGGLWPLSPQLWVGVARVGVLTVKLLQGTATGARARASSAQLPSVAVTLITSH